MESARGPGRTSIRATVARLALTVGLLAPLLPLDGAARTDADPPRAHTSGAQLATARAARPAGDPNWDQGPPTAERETCADGRDPAASLRPATEAGAAVRRVRDRGRLIVGVDQNSYLWGYRDPDNGEITGFDIDLVKAIARDLLGPRARIVYKTIPTDQRLSAIQRGAVDMVVRTMSITCDRKKKVAFSTAYFEAGQQVLVPKSSAVDGYNASLRGQRVCTAKGSTGQALLERASHGATPVYVSNQLDCLVRLQLGSVDAVLTDNALAAGQAAQDPMVHLVGDPVTVEPYGVALHRADEDLVRWVNAVLEDYRKGGRSSLWRKAYQTWLADMMSDPDPDPPAPVYQD